MKGLQAARIISIAAHPFLLAPLTVALVTRHWRWAAVIAAATSIPLLLLILRNVRRGTFSDVDVSDPKQRPGLYRLGFPLLAILAGLLYVLHAPPAFLRATAALAVTFAIGLLVNRRLKVSLHMIFAAFCAVLIAREYPAWTPAAAAIPAAMAWSRWRLTRHTPPEIAAGLVLGLAAGLYTIL